MAAAANDIVLLADAKSYLGIPNATTSDDALIQRWITSFSSYAENYCSRKFAVQSIQGEIYDGDGNRRLYVRYAPIYSFYTTSDPTQDILFRLAPDAAYQILEDTASWIGFKAIEPFYIELFRRAFYKGWQNIKVSYKAGYGTTTDGLIPADIQEAAFNWVQMRWNQVKAKGNMLGKDVETITGPSGNVTTQLNDLDGYIRAVLDQYKRSLAVLPQSGQASYL